jgi:hypothetical protein
MIMDDEHMDDDVRWKNSRSKSDDQHSAVLDVKWIAENGLLNVKTLHLIGLNLEALNIFVERQLMEENSASIATSDSDEWMLQTLARERIKQAHLAKERDLAVKKRDLAVRERDLAVRERDNLADDDIRKSMADSFLVNTQRMMAHLFLFLFGVLDSSWSPHFRGM